MDGITSTAESLARSPDLSGSIEPTVFDPEVYIPTEIQEMLAAIGA